MNKNLRKAIIAGNWKMNMDRKGAEKLITELKPIAADKTCGVVICVPYTDLETALRLTEGTNIAVGAENCHFKKSGAFTGEISADMLKEMGVEYVIIGHSERRQYFAETDATVNLKVHAALKAGLRPIVCVGETLEQRDLGITIEHIRLQVKSALSGVDSANIKRIVIAYEPIWAIGTGRTATSDQAEEVCGAIRDCIREMYGARVARSVTIQYGGSMNASNAAELLSKPNVDGGLIGGASLKPLDFATIVNAANQ